MEINSNLFSRYGLFLIEKGGIVPASHSDTKTGNTNIFFQQKNCRSCHGVEQSKSYAKPNHLNQIIDLDSLDVFKKVGPGSSCKWSEMGPL